MSSPRPDQSCGRRDRVGWGQSCYLHPPSGYGTGRIGSGRSLDEVREACAITTMTLGVLSMYSYLEKVGTLLRIACRHVSALCMAMKKDQAEQSAARPPFVAKLPPRARRLLSCYKLHGLFSGCSLLSKRAAFRFARTQWVLGGLARRQMADDVRQV
jgi:hypothetical protein